MLPIFQYLNKSKIKAGAPINEETLAAADFKAILFVHVPKTGGTTIEKFFQSIGMTGFFLNEQIATIRHLLPVPPATFDARILEQIILMESIYSFAVVREPIDRMISNYRWARSDSSGVGVYDSMSFDEFVEHAIAKYSLGDHYMGGHIKPQFLYVGEGVDRYKFEDGLEGALKAVLDKVGISLNGEITGLPITNRSSGAHPSISNETRRLLETFYAKDFELFGY